MRVERINKTPYNITLSMQRIHKICLFVLIALLAVVGMQAQKHVYGFAYATSLKDSVVYVSTIQQIPDAQIGRDGFLNYRADFGAQFGAYVQQYFDHPNVTSVVVFHKKRKKLEKRYLKMRKLAQQEQGKRIVEINYSDFKFQTIE
jgi:hypothetical protein